MGSMGWGGIACGGRVRFCGVGCYGVGWGGVGWVFV